MPTLLDALLPVRCAACGRPAPAGLCYDCQHAAAELALPSHGFAVLTQCVAAVGVYAYTHVVADAVRGMKASGRWAAARPLGAAMRQALELSTWPVTWVPSTRRRLRERGIDIPQLLAGRQAEPLLRRAIDRADQTSLSAEERRTLPAGAFTAIAAVPPAVVLVDDVRTTGATASAAAAALVEAGASKVLVATLAVGGDAARATVNTGSLPAIRRTPRSWVS